MSSDFSKLEARIDKEVEKREDQFGSVYRKMDMHYQTLDRKIDTYRESLENKIDELPSRIYKRSTDVCSTQPQIQMQKKNGDTGWKVAIGTIVMLLSP